MTAEGVNIIRDSDGRKLDGVSRSPVRLPLGPSACWRASWSGNSGAESRFDCTSIEPLAVLSGLGRRTLEKHAAVYYTFNMQLSC